MIQNLLTATQDGDHKKKLAFLFDIGCNLEKGIINVGISSATLL
jgi:hypothetical protein